MESDVPPLPERAEQLVRSPFDVTKAVDLNDPQIELTYVSFGGRDRSIVDPASAMPQFLTGLKGGGRTHLLRHYSYPLQKTRSDRPLHQVQADGYIGIYFRCGGLNGSRFRGKGQPAEQWATTFAYYMDLWLTELLLATVADLSESEQWRNSETAKVYVAIARALQANVSGADEVVDPLSAILGYLTQLRREIDWAVNNAAHTGRLDIQVRSNPGELIFAAAKSVSTLPGFQDVTITFLADEYENLTESQQIYFNTLIREKEAPATFLVGGRSWGIRTHKTLSAGEVNKKGSEYELYPIDTAYASDPAEYQNFCRDLIMRRLAAFDLDEQESAGWISRLSFGADDRLHTRRLHDVLARYTALERPYLVDLRNAVSKAQGSRIASGVVDALSMPRYPLIEKLAILRFYQLWYAGQEPSAESAAAARDFVAPLADGTEDVELTNFFKQRKSDAIAQIYAGAGRQTAYAGFTELVALSGFLPRNLLMILKYVSHWAQFHGENVFRGSGQISERALSEGVLDASNWYLADAKPLGTQGEECEIAIRRLGQYMHSIRYADKPSEIDIATFSTSLSQVSPDALAVLERCVSHGLLVEVRGGRSARNHGPRHRKFQLHPMLTPMWGLRPGRRGDATLDRATVEAIFNPKVEDLAFQQVREALEMSLNAPFASIKDALF
ncbi:MULTISPECIES: ORC-CDC6 family AAA ATPase [unclassified Microbacterium]|uniref:ORC-CDC6 family AAA ATPase n=1 Tax=unclassified Microbacterium TaxID=2609290 RepID=UPI00300FD55F